jgi:hypothetical protein
VVQWLPCKHEALSSNLSSTHTHTHTHTKCKQVMPSSLRIKCDLLVTCKTIHDLNSQCSMSLHFPHSFWPYRDIGFLQSYDPLFPFYSLYFLLRICCGLY